MYEVIGIEKREGVYEGKAYNNTILHVTFTKDTPNAVGVCTAILKIKTSNLPSVKLGDFVDPLYDKYGNVVYLNVKAE